jgi:hypothetical protein
MQGRQKKVVREKDRSIKDWQEVFRELYSQADSTRTPEQMWIAVMAHTSSIGESIRKFAFENLLDSAAHTFCWLCSFVNKCNKLENDVFSITDSLCGIVSLMYPKVCGHCQHNPCNCDPVSIEGKKDKSALYQDLLRRRRNVLASFEGYSIKDALEDFDDIYRGRIHIQTLENIGFHFLEEVGEAAVRVRQLSQLRKVTNDVNTGIDLAFLRELSTVEGIVKNYLKHEESLKHIDYASRDPKMLKARLVGAKMGLVAEIADSFSWFCSILKKLDSISKSIHKNPEKHEHIIRPLEQVLNETYFNSNGNARCPSCNSNPCNCAFYNLVIENRLTPMTSEKERKVV